MPGLTETLARTWPLWLLAPVLVLAAAGDLARGRIANWLTLPAMAAGLIGHTLAGGLFGGAYGLGLWGALAGLAAGGLPLLVAFLAGAVGAGDVKLMGAIGALVGWRLALATMVYGFLAAGVLAAIVMIRRRVVKRTLRRVGRFLLTALMPGGATDPATADSPTVPLGLALCVGAVAAAAESVLLQRDAAEWLLGF
jgi:prepilin peptidase CpaA